MPMRSMEAFAAVTNDEVTASFHGLGMNLVAMTT